MSELGSNTQPDDASDSNIKEDKPAEDSSKLDIENEAEKKENSKPDHDSHLKSKSEIKKKKNSKCSSCCCCRGQNSDDELRTETKAASNTEVSGPTNFERGSQTDSINLEAKDTSVTSLPVSSAESSYSPPIKHYKTPKFWPKKTEKSDQDDESVEDVESTSAGFQPPAKLNLPGNEKRDVELLEKKRSHKDDDEDSPVETIQLTKPDKNEASKSASREKSLDQDDMIISSDPKNPACFGCKTWK